MILWAGQNLRCMTQEGLRLLTLTVLVQEVDAGCGKSSTRSLEPLILKPSTQNLNNPTL